MFCLCSQLNKIEVNSPFFTRKCIIMHYKDVDVSVNLNVLVSSINNSSLVSTAVESDAESVSQAMGDKMVVQSPKGGSEVIGVYSNLLSTLVLGTGQVLESGLILQLSLI